MCNDSLTCSFYEFLVDLEKIWAVFAFSRGVPPVLAKSFISQKKSSRQEGDYEDLKY